MRHGTAIDQDLAGGDVLEPGDHPQQRRLAAAGGAEDDDELADLDVEVDTFDDLLAAIGFPHRSQAEALHRILGPVICLR